MKNLFLCLLACLLSIYAQAQRTSTIVIRGTGTVERSGNMSTGTLKVPDQKEIGKAVMEFIYDYSYLRDTIHGKLEIKELSGRISETKDQMLLQVASGMSKFTSYRGMLIDSLMRVSTVEQFMANPDRYMGGETFSVFKNYPAGKFTTTDKISMDWFMYEEDTPVQEWTIDDESTKEILGYQCRRATCDFRGRKYIAWYSDEIPVADGPWKFGGLPGLIMEVSDSEEHYSFTLVGINSKATRAITMQDVQYMKTTRDKYYNTKRKHDTDPVGYMTAATAALGAKVTISSQGTVNGVPTDVSEFMRPNELNYDYIERDY